MSRQRKSPETRRRRYRRKQVEGGGLTKSAGPVDALASKQPSDSDSAAPTSPGRNDEEIDDIPTTEICARFLFLVLVLFLAIALPALSLYTTHLLGLRAYGYVRDDLVGGFCKANYAHLFETEDMEAVIKKNTQNLLKGFAMVIGLLITVVVTGTLYLWWVKSSEIEEQRKTIRKIQEWSAQEVDKLCCICFDQVKSVLLIPCNHVCICSGCLQELRRPNCPICNGRVTRYLDKVYV